MFVVESLETHFTKEGKIKGQNRQTDYFDDLDDAMSYYKYEEDNFSKYYISNVCIVVLSIFGGSELLKMRTFRQKEN